MDLLELPDQMAYGLIETVDESGTPDGVVRLECQFNPTDLTVRKSVVWSGGSAGENHTPGRNAPDLDFGGGKPATFSLNLLFDTTREPLMVDRDVRQYTDQLLRLTLMRSSGGKVLPPPLVSFQWNGLPARARAEVQFTQQDPADDETAYQNPTTRTEARKTRVVQAGDRLDLIAYRVGGSQSPEQSP